MEATCTPRVERKVVAANVTSSSREQASEPLQDLADLSVSGKRCERISQRVGAPRVAEREQRLQQYQAFPLPQQREVPADAPLGGWDHRVAVVMVDGARAQLRDERWGQPRAKGTEKPRWWRESKVSMVATFCGESHEVDPMPDVPENLLDPLWLIPRINEMKVLARGGRTHAPTRCRQNQRNRAAGNLLEKQSRNPERQAQIPCQSLTTLSCTHPAGARFLVILTQIPTYQALTCFSAPHLFRSPSETFCNARGLLRWVVVSFHLARRKTRYV